MKWRETLLFFITTGIIVAVSLLDPIAQDPQYHRFADTREIMGIPNFMDVTSNLPFLIIGVAGLALIVKKGASITPEARIVWLMFFFGVALTALGSGYYHWSPANEPLVWDRIPMTIGITSLISVVIAEYLNAQLAKRLLLPLLLIGIASVLFWSHTESLGRGDLRPYAIVQFIPMALIPLIAVLYRGRSNLGRYLGWMIGFYVAAKIAEHFDTEIFASNHVVGGHALKHFLAALAPASLLYALWQRSNQSQQEH